MLIDDGWIPLPGDVARTEDALRERDRHLRVARQLAREIAAPEARVIEAYERELARLTGSARVKQFLAIIVAKHVKIEFERRDEQGSAMPYPSGQGCPT